MCKQISVTILTALVVGTLALRTSAGAKSVPANQQPAWQTPPGSGRPYTVATAAKAAFEQLKQHVETELITKNKKGFTRVGNKFYFRLTDGKQVKLLSKPSAKFEEDVAEITYLGRLPYLKKYLVQVMEWEGSEFLLIDQETGGIDKLQGTPDPSPNVKRVAILFEGYPFDGATNGVDVYTVKQNKLRVKFTVESEKWSPQAIAWLDDNSFILKCLPTSELLKANGTAELNKLLKNTKKYFYLRVTAK